MDRRQLLVWRHLPTALLCAAAATLGARSAAGQQRPARFWVSLGAGNGAAPERQRLPAFVGQLNYQQGPHYGGLRLTFLGNPITGPDEGHADSFVEFGGLYGRAYARPYFHSAIAAGLAFTHLDPCRSGVECTTAGVPVLAEAAVRMQVIGIGVQAFANLNKERVYRGAAVIIQLGWMP